MRTPGFWERRRARKAFEKCVSPGVIRLMEKIEKSPESWIRGPEEKHFQFVVVLLDDSRPDDVPDTLNKVAEATLRHPAMISNISASIVIACLGVPFADGDSVEERRRLVNKLVTENGSRIRVAHGQCNGLVGNLGCKSRFVYEAVIPGFNSILKQLLAADAGSVLEVTPTNE